MHRKENRLKLQFSEENTLDERFTNTKRSRAIYKTKGYPEDWIEKRMRGIAIREQLTNEWEKRDIKEEREYCILAGKSGRS